MFTTVWDDPDERFYHHGLDRGVVYTNGVGTAWNGLTAVTENSDGEARVLYQDGEITTADYNPGDYSATITALFFPDVFLKCLGVPEIIDGLFVDNQRPQPFHLSYRSLVGSGSEGDMFGYQIHLVYNAVAYLPSRAHATGSNTPNPEDFSFNIVARPEGLVGHRPSAHYFIDTRFTDPDILAQIEAVLYGNGTTAGRMPTLQELYDLIDVGDVIIFTDTGNGTWKAKGSNKNVYKTSKWNWVIKNVNGTDNGDGTYTLEDTP